MIARTNNEVTPLADGILTITERAHRACTPCLCACVSPRTRERARSEPRPPPTHRHIQIRRSLFRTSLPTRFPPWPLSGFTVLSNQEESIMVLLFCSVYVFIDACKMHLMRFEIGLI